MFWMNDDYVYDMDIIRLSLGNIYCVVFNGTFDQFPVESYGYWFTKKQINMYSIHSGFIATICVLHISIVWLLTIMF